MTSRDITQKEIIEGIKNGSKQIENPSKILSHFRNFSIVYKKEIDDFYVIGLKSRWYAQSVKKEHWKKEK